MRVAWCSVVVHGDWFWLVTQQDAANVLVVVISVVKNDSSKSSQVSCFSGDVLFGGSVTAIGFGCYWLWLVMSFQLLFEERGVRW